MKNYKIFEFLQEDNGSFSSTRLFAFAIITSAIIEWQHAIWYLGGIWKPDYMTVGLIAGVLGFKVLQKSSEQKVKLQEEKKEPVKEESKDISENEIPVG